MSDEQIGAVLWRLALLLALGRLLGRASSRLRQPELAGEILAGALLAPFVWPLASGGAMPTTAGAGIALLLDFVAQFGLLLLMFISGTEVRHVIARENRSTTFWLVGLGASLPFAAALMIAPLFSLDWLTGPGGNRISVLLVLATSASVMSLPVITRIFHDLGILRTRFAALMLSVALLEDIILWCVLAAAIAIAKAAPQDMALAAIGSHVAITALYAAGAFMLAPAVIERLRSGLLKGFIAAYPASWPLLILLTYASVAALMGVNLVLAAFLAGFGLAARNPERDLTPAATPLTSIAHVAFGLFIPLYFVSVGLHIDVSHGFSLPLFVAFFLGSSLLRLAAVAIAALAAGFRGLDVVNLAVTANARGGPGIVVATVALAEGIIDRQLFTALVLTAILTSQAAGAWLAWLMRRQQPLLSDAALRRLDGESRRTPPEMALPVSSGA